MAELNARLRTDDEMHQALAWSIEKYVSEREAIEPLGAKGHPGGGPDRVKCLHAHVAHELITRDNPVGAEVLASLGWSDPNEACV